MSNARVAIVDPFSSGAMLARELCDRDVTCIAILSSPRIPRDMRSRFDSDAFAAVIEFDGDSTAALETLKHHDLSHVVPGFESGVLLADYLSEALSLPTNGTSLASARRDKYLMNDTVRRSGLRVPRTFSSGHVPDVIEWTRTTLDWPVILKPPRSVASDHVVRCAGEEDVRRAADAILNSPNVLGETNEAVLVQEFLEGTEYVVDTVSLAGRHKTTAFWQYHHPDDDPHRVGYDAMTLLPYRGERQEALEAYASNVLDALDIRFGPAHCEIMWADGGPQLVEVGARLSAGINAVLSRLCGGICQLDETVTVLMTPERFQDAPSEQRPLSGHGGNVFLLPPQPGRLTRLRGVDIIESLPTLHSLSIGARPGEPVPRVAGMVTLIGDDTQQVERDMGTIRQLVRDGLFDVEPESES